jgi:3-oxoacyl-[acyl-carrier protein] reductase
MIILITGTSRGIGKQLAQNYIAAGHTVIGCSRSATDLVNENYAHYILDITDEKSVKNMFSEIRKKHARLDVLINNAAVNQTLAPVLLVSLQAAMNTININFIGTFLLSREAAKVMMKNNFGRIINLGSMAIRHEEKGEAIYTASKAAVVSFTKILAKEIYQQGITCNVVSPSAIDTDLLQGIGSAALEKVLQRNAIPEIGTVKELISTLDWLIDPVNNKITGQHIYLGGV